MSHYFFLSLLHLGEFYPHVSLATKASNFTENQDRRKTNEENQTNNPNQHINHKTPNGTPQGMLHNTCPADDAVPSEALPY